MEPQQAPAPQQPQPAQPIPTQQPAQQPPLKMSPPVSVQVLYALGIIGLILGSVLAIITFAAVNATILPEGFGDSVRLFALFFAAVVVCGFFLIAHIRSGKQWALIAYTILFVLGLIGTVTGKTSDSGVLNYIIDAIIALLLALMRTKDRQYFS